MSASRNPDLRLRTARIVQSAIRPCFEPLEIRRLLNGDIDTSFGTSGKAITDFGSSQDIGDGLAVLSSGGFIVVGESAGNFALAKYNADGSPDTSFGGGTGRLTTPIGSAAHATAVAIDGSGRIVVAGYAQIGSTQDFALARYSSAGVLDNSFDSDGIVTTDFASRRDNCFALAILPTGEIVAIGIVSTGPAGVNDDFGVAVYDPANGALASSFDGDGKATTDFGGEEDARGVAYDASLGRIVVAGESDGQFALAGFVASTGALDTGFSGDGKLTTIFAGSAAALAVAVDSGGRYVVAGKSGPDFAVARYNDPGALDNSFDTDGMLTLDFNGGVDQANALAIQADGKIVLAGIASGSSANFGVARLTAAGALDTTFGAATGKLMTDVQGAADSAAAVAIQPTTGKLLVAGTSNGGASQDDFATVRYESVQHQVWVNDNWVITNDVGPTGMSFGDTVQNTGSGDTGALVTKIAGYDAFATLANGLAAVASGAGNRVNVEAGSYLESDISITKRITIDGIAASSDDVVIAPAVADDHATTEGAMFNPLTHNALVIRHADVAISDLTIDGDAGVGGAGSRNYFGGIVYDSTLGTAFNNLSVANVAVRNLWSTGIYFDGGTGALSTGHSITGNTVTNIAGGTLPAGILLLQASGSVFDNDVTDIAGHGIGTNYVDGEAFAPTVSIRFNRLSDVDVAMSLSGLAGGSAVGGPNAGDKNTIDLTGGGASDVGIALQFSVGAVTIQNNDITATAGDSAIWLHHNPTAAATVVTGNTLTASSVTGSGAGESTGIFVTDDGSFFGKTSGGDTYATLTGNAITGFARGIDLVRSEDNPAGGFAVQATINGNNQITGNGIGVRIFDANGSTGADGSAIIQNNSTSIHGNTTGIEIDGGTATITNNHIYDNATGIRIISSFGVTISDNAFDTLATALIVGNSQDTSFTGNAIAGATSSAIFVGAGNDDLSINQNAITGGAASAISIDSGGGAANTDVEINNNFLTGNTIGINVAAGALGNALDARENDFSGNSTLGVKNLGAAMVDASYSWWGSSVASAVQTSANGGVNVDFNPFANIGTDAQPGVKGWQPTPSFSSSGLSISGASSINEGASYALTLNNDGTSGNIDSWTIDWGDGVIQTIPTPHLSTTYPHVVNHAYADGLNNCTISATATDDQPQVLTVSNTVAVTVNNVAPTIALTGNTDANEGSSYTLNLGAVVDPGTDAVTDYVIHWGDGNNQNFTGNPASTSPTHTYADDNPSGTVQDAYTITIDLIDEDGTHLVAGTKGITVHNVAPAPTINGVATSPEGTLISLTSSIIDPGLPSDTLVYAWSVTKNGNPFGTPGTSANYSFTPNDNGTYVVSLQVTDDDTGVGNTNKTITVTDVAPTIAIGGASSVNEGSVYTLSLGAITDPAGGNDTVTRYIIDWGDGAFDDITGNPVSTNHPHTYAEGPAVRSISIALFDEDGVPPGTPHTNAQTPNPFNVTVNNVAPTATIFNGGAVSEGNNGLVGFAGQFDPSAQDTSAGFRYSYDFNNDGDFTDALELQDVVNSSVGLPAIYLADGPGSRTVRARIKDDDGGFTDYTTTLTINNVTPFVNPGPTIVVGATVPFTQVGSFTDPGADSPWTAKVDYEWHPGDLITDGDVQNLPLSGFNYTLSHAYATSGTYTVRVYVTDKDNATGTGDVTVNVGPVPTFQVTQFLTQPSGFSLRFNRAPNFSVLNIFDGIDGITPSNDAADITLVGNSLGPVRGSLAWNAVTNVLTFVRTGGVLLNDTYNLTVRSANNALKDAAGALLDGNADSVPGDDFLRSFSVAPPPGRIISMPDFARGPNSLGTINVPNTGTLGLPVNIDDADSVVSADFTISYDPALLDITAVTLGQGMPGSGWSVTANLTTPGTAIISVSGTTPLTAGPRNLVKLTANVPNTAPYLAANLLRITNITVKDNAAATITTRGDSAIQKVIYFGDADGNRAYTGNDASLISRVVVSLDSGFHAARMTDPIIISDIDGSNTVDGVDASFVAQKAALLPRAEIPNLPGVLPPLVGGGVDPLISGATNVPGRPNGTAIESINIDDATNTRGFNVTLDYSTSLGLVHVTDDVGGVSPDVALGSLYAGAGGWSLVANVDDSTGMITLVFWRANGIPMPGGTGPIADVTFHLSGTVVHNQLIPIDVSGPGSDQGLTFTHADGSILVDAVSPTGAFNTYHYETSPHTLSFQFNENVSASLSAADLTVFNVTTSTTIPSGQFTLTNYNTTNNVATFTYTGGAFLPDGDYTATITAAGVTDPAGNPLTANAVGNFFFLMADANHDRRVNVNDFTILAANFNQTGKNFTQGDFNYDGIVNVNDFTILASRFNSALAADHSQTPPSGDPPVLPPALAGGTVGAPGKRTAGTTTLGRIEGSLAIPTTVASRANPPATLWSSKRIIDGDDELGTAV